MSKVSNNLIIDGISTINAKFLSISVEKSILFSFFPHHRNKIMRFQSQGKEMTLIVEKG